MLSRRLILAVLVILVAGLAVTPALTQDDLMGDFTRFPLLRRLRRRIHRWQIVDAFIAENPGLMHAASPVDHEQFKTSILVQLAGGNPPDTFSYWAGARIQFVVDGGRLACRSMTSGKRTIWIRNSRRRSSTTPPPYDMHKLRRALDLALGRYVFYNTALFEASWRDGTDKLGRVG